MNYSINLRRIVTVLAVLAAIVALIYTEPVAANTIPESVITSQQYPPTAIFSQHFYLSIIPIVANVRTTGDKYCWDDC